MEESMDPLPQDILDTSQLCFEGDFTSQMDHILENVRLKSGDVTNLSHLFDDLEKALQMIWPRCEVQPFGSIVTGLGIRTSDVDCFVSLPVEVEGKKAVSLARNRLQRHPMMFTELFAITSAKVPIVKFLHIPTNCYCDVSFKSPSGVRNSKLIAFLLHMDQRALPLAVILKYWSKVHRFTGTNLMPNYALTMLVIFYLQQKGILPPVSKLQTNTDLLTVDHWNTSFDSEYQHTISNDESMYDLMGGFFIYYATFNFDENIVSPFLGYPVNKNTFANLDSVPDEYYYYRNNVNNKLCKPLRLETKMCVQDPFEHSRNCSVAMYPKLVDKLIAYIQLAAKAFDGESNSDFLRAILTHDSQPGSEQKSHKQRHRFGGKVKKNVKGHANNLHVNFKRHFSLKRLTRGKR